MKITFPTFDTTAVKRLLWSCGLATALSACAGGEQNASSSSFIAESLSSAIPSSEAISSSSTASESSSSVLATSSSMPSSANSSLSNSSASSSSDGPSAGHTVVPEKIEAESFSAQQGVQVADTSDTQGEQQLGYILNGSYAEYPIYVPEDGTYFLNARVATIYADSSIEVLSDGMSVGTITVPETGAWNTFSTLRSSINLPAGNQTLRLVFTATHSNRYLLNVNWFEILDGPLPGSAIIPAQVQAENFSVQEGVRVEDTADETGIQHLGYITNGSYAEYQIYVPIEGAYFFNARASTVNEGGSISILSNNQTVGAVAIPSTQAWSTFRTVSSSIELPAGNQTLRLSFNTTNASRYLFNLNWFDISKEDLAEPDPADDYDVSSLQELRDAIQLDNQDIVMKPGNYSITDLPDGMRDLPFSGSNSTIDLTGVYVDVPISSTLQASYITMEGSNINLIGGEFEDTYLNGAEAITDFIAYNNNRATLAYGLRGAAVMRVSGNGNVIDGLKLTVRGSYPFGYGSIFGIGSDNMFGLSKRCGIVVTGGSDNTLQNVEVQQQAFCHGIYIQSGADNTIIRNALVEGLVRPTNEILAEGAGSLPEQANYMTVGEIPIPPNEVLSLAEDGIRAYSGIGSVTVENSTVRRMRGGIRLYLAGSATVSNSQAIDCGMTNWNMPAGGTVTQSSGNFTYSPLSDFRLSRSRQKMEMTILPSPNAVGAHNIADILGSSHEIVFHRATGPVDADEERAIVVYGNNSTIRNETEYKIILNAGTSGNTIISAGEVTDLGSNTVSSIPLSTN